MDPLSTVCILMGVLIVATRGPLLFAPEATIRVYKRSISSDTRVRAVGLGILALGLVLVWFPLGDGALAVILEILGWLFVISAAWLVAAPTSYRRFAGAVIEVFESSVDSAVLRMIGLMAVGIGAGLIYFGVYGG